MEEPNDSTTAENNENSWATIFDLAKRGLLIPMQNLASDNGSHILHSKDERGYTLPHWASLGGHLEILKYLVEKGVEINVPAVAEPQPCPIHWACSKGHVGVVDYLLQQGVDIDTIDSKGCTPLIVAAQYGQTLLSAYLLGKGAAIHITDKDGDTALHWAAFKGHSELLKLLLYSGFSAKQKDSYGQTALHLACIEGSLDVVKELCDQEGVELDSADKNGKTPYLLAVGRKHEHITSYLKKRIHKSRNLLANIDWKTIAFGPPGNSKYPMVFFLTVMLLYAYPIYLYKCLYNTWDEIPRLHIAFWITNVIMWISLYVANGTDPGYIPRNVPEYDMAIKQVANYTTWSSGQEDENPLSRLCHTCRTIKPARSKHCRVCNRCVEYFDHHCPWIYNCVGYKNRVWFLGFVSMISLNYILGLYFLYKGVYCVDGMSYLVVSTIPLVLFGLIMTDVLLFFTLYQAAMNLTTNENANWRRYKYLHDSSGKYRNPYDRGCFNNYREFLYLLQPSTHISLQDIKVM